MPHSSIYHLPSTGSNHTPLLLEMVDNKANHIKYFKFLNCWTEHQSFIDTVSSCWNRPMKGSPMWVFHYKLKRLSSTLSNWSRDTFGDIYAKVKEFEVKVKVAEENLINTNDDYDRAALHSLNANYIRYLKLESSILNQKTQLQWFQEQEVNYSYFHALIRGRRRRLHIHTSKMMKENDFKVMRRLLQLLVLISRKSFLVKTSTFRNKLFIVFLKWLLMNRMISSRYAHYG